MHQLLVQAFELGNDFEQFAPGVGIRRCDRVFASRRWRQDGGFHVVNALAGLVTRLHDRFRVGNEIADTAALTQQFLHALVFVGTPTEDGRDALGMNSRLHDRIQFTRQPDQSWAAQRLQP